MLAGETAGIQEKLLEGGIEQYYSWVEEELLSPGQVSSVKNKLGKLGIAFGAIGTLMSARIAYEFGSKLTNKLPPYILGTYFGVTTGLTIGAGMVTMSYDSFRRLANTTPESRKQIIKKNYCSPLTTSVLIVIAGISSIYITYLTDDRFSNELHKGTFVLDFPTLLANLAVSYWVIDKQLSLLYNTLRYSLGPKLPCVGVRERIKMERELDATLNAVLMKIFSLSNAEADTLHEKILGAQAMDRDTQEKFQELYALITTQSVQPSKNLKKTLFGALGTAIGIVSPYFVFNVTRSAGIWICNLFGVYDEEVIDKFSQTFAWSSFLTASALAAYTSKIGFDKIYKAFSRNSNKKCKEAVDWNVAGKFMLATSATSYRLDLTLDSTNGSNGLSILLGICSVLGPFSTYYWGLDYTQQKMKGITSKDKLASLMMQIIHLLPEMQDVYLKALHENIYFSMQQAGSNGKLRVQVQNGSGDATKSISLVDPGTHADQPRQMTVQFDSQKKPPKDSETPGLLQNNRTSVSKSRQSP